MLIFQDIVKLKKEVFEIVNMKKIKIISLDGKNGSGKSYLSGFLSKNFEYRSRIDKQLKHYNGELPWLKI